MIDEKIILRIVNELLDDEQFVLDIKYEIDKILKDKEININDIPEILSIIIVISNKYYLFYDIDKNDIIEIFSIVIVEIFKRFNILQNEKNQQKLNKIIYSSLQLLTLKITIKKHKCLSFKKLFNCFRKKK